MKKEMTEAEALTRAAAFCSTTEHCRAEVHDKLMRWEMKPDAAERILQYLEKERFLDDERYCRAYVRDKYRFAKWGRLKITRELCAKRISASLVRQILEEEIDEDGYRDMLRALLEAKRRTVRAGSDYELRGKLARFAMSRGFEYETIASCMDLSDD